MNALGILQHPFGMFLEFPHFQYIRGISLEYSSNAPGKLFLDCLRYIPRAFPYVSLYISENSRDVSQAIRGKFSEHFRKLVEYTWSVHRSAVQGARRCCKELLICAFENRDFPGCSWAPQKPQELQNFKH